MEQSAEARDENKAPDDGIEVFETGDLEVISINDSLQVTVADDPNPSNYYSRVNNVEEGRLIIAWPTQRGIRLPVRRDQKLNFTFLHNGIPFVFSGIVDETSSGSLPEITVITVGPVIKTQRRHNFRMKCLVPVEIIWTEYLPESGKGMENVGNITTSTYDLSAGGVGIRWQKTIPEGTPVEVKLNVPDDGPLMKIPCRVAYTEKLPDNPSMTHIGIQFLAISEREQARIIRYLNRLQIQSLHV